MKPLKFLKELVKEIKEDKKNLAEREREAKAWKKAGRPTGPNSDQSWKDTL